MIAAPNKDNRPLLSLRSTVVLTLALLSGLAAGTLSYAAGRKLPVSVLAGLAAAAAALPLFHGIIAQTDGNDTSRM